MHLNPMKPFPLFFLLLFLFLGTIKPVAAQQEVTFSIVNPTVVGPTLTYEIWARSTGNPPELRVGLADFYFTFNNNGLQNPVISEINPKYTEGSPTESYDAITSASTNGSFYINIKYNFMGPGDLLSMEAPNGEKICRVTFSIKNSVETGTVRWDITNSGFMNPDFELPARVYRGNIENMSLLPETTLPITLTSFSADLQPSGSVEIKWNTAMEKDNKEFIVQRSQDAVTFTDMRSLPGAGTSMAARRYALLDASPLTGTSYYRLMQVDYSGDAAYSKVVSVSNNAPHAAPLLVKSARPNPFRDQTEITYHLPAAASTLLTLSDAMGKVMVTATAEGRAGSNTFILKGDQLPDGLYYLNLTSGRTRSSFKLVRGR
jgi:hypothetical protein